MAEADTLVVSRERARRFDPALVCCLTNTIACQRPFLVTKHILIITQTKRNLSSRSGIGGVRSAT